MKILKMKFDPLYRLFAGTMAVILLSCQSHDESNLLLIHVPNEFGDNVTMRDLADSIRLVELETQQASLVSSISEVVYDGKNLIISTLEGKVMVFDLAGNFIQSLGKQGDGPGEHRYVSSIAVEKTSGKIYLVGRGKILVYSSEYQLVDEIKLDFHLNYFKPMGRTNLGISNEYGRAVENGFVNETKLLWLDSKMDPFDTISLRAAFVEKQVASSLGYKDYVSIIDDKLYLYTPVATNEEILRDTLFQLSEKQLIPFAKLNFHKPHVNEKGIKRYWIACIVNTYSYISAVYYDDKNEVINLIHSKAKVQSWVFKKGILDHTGTPVLLRPLIPEQDVFYYVKKFEFSGQKVEEKNPTIGIVKLK